MSWQDTYTQRLIITLTKTVGSQKQTKDFAVVTRPAYEKNMEWNATEYSFVNIDGVLVKKRKLLKRDFNVDFYFIGDDNTDQGEDFANWCMSEYPWLITHPYYGSILCQVVKLNFNNLSLNVTQVTGTAVETIDEETAKFISKDPKKRINNTVAEVDEILTSPLYRVKYKPSVNDKDVLKQQTSNYYKAFSKIVDVVEEAAEYQNAFTEVNTAIDQATALPIFAIQALNTFLLSPFIFTASIKDKIRTITNQFAQFRSTISAYTTVSQKTQYEIIGGGFLQTACLSAVNPIAGDYLRALTALETIESIRSLKRQFDEDISELQSPNGSNPEYYVPNAELITALDSLVTTTISNLYVIALSGQREFELIVENDTNVFLLTHRFYGLDEADDNIKRMIDSNNLTYQQVGLGIMKGTKIVFYK